MLTTDAFNAVEDPGGASVPCGVCAGYYGTHKVQVPSVNASSLSLGSDRSEIGQRIKLWLSRGHRVTDAAVLIARHASGGCRVALVSLTSVLPLRDQLTEQVVADALGVCPQRSLLDLPELSPLGHSPRNADIARGSFQWQDLRRLAQDVGGVFRRALGEGEG